MLLATFLIYLAILVLIGFVTYRLSKTFDDFILAGRKLGVWVTAISAKASDMSGWLLLGVPGKAYVYGFGSLWIALACIAGTLFNWSCLAGRLRRYTEYLGSLTLPDFFESRFKAGGSKALRLIPSIILVVFMVLYVASQFSASEKAISATFNLDSRVSLVLGAAVIMFYTMMGGFFAVAWTDLFQGLLMVLALVVLPFVGILHIGGLDKMVIAMESVDKNLLSLNSGKMGLGMVTFILGWLAIGLGYPGQPHIISRYMAIREPGKIKQAAIISMIWVILSVFGALFIGFVAHGLLGKVDDPEKILPLLVLKIMPPWLAGILIAAAMAAIMSTADSQLLVATSTIVEDFYHKFLNHEVDQAKLVIYSRIVTLLLGLVALSLVWSKKGSDIVFQLVLYAWGGLAASFGPAIILSLWWRRTTKWGVISGMLVGSITIIIWNNVPQLSAIVYELFPGFIFSMSAIILVSYLTQPPGGVDEEFKQAMGVGSRADSNPGLMKSQMAIVINFLETAKNTKHRLSTAM